MKIRLLTITHKTPSWLKMGYEEYAKRLPPHCALTLIEIPAEKRFKDSNIQQLTQREGEKMLALIKPHHHVVTLDVKGEKWSTEQLAMQVATWQQNGKPIDLLIGGPDGLASLCTERANQSWSLSPLTFPHFLVRLIVAEQIYRAYTLQSQHPYHR